MQPTHKHTQRQTCTRIYSYSEFPHSIRVPRQHAFAFDKSRNKKKYMARQTIKCSAFLLALAAFLKTKVSHLARTAVTLCDHAAGTLSREHRMHSE